MAEDVQALMAESKKFFPNPLAEFIYFRTYARWKEEQERRETWVETVDRYMNFMRENLGALLFASDEQRMRNAILHQQVMPSMRLLWAAGEAARQNNAVAYNCAYVAPESLKDIAEIMYLLMCGVGVGFSVEKKVTARLPEIKRQTDAPLLHKIVEDTREGWAEVLKLALETWFSGGDVEFDFSRIRPKGMRLKTLGGRSSGPEPLQELFAFLRTFILERQGRRLRPIEVHDLICRVSEVVIMGGVRRAALISLSDLDDEEMRTAKNGSFYTLHPERAMANNSTVYLEKPPEAVFLQEWKNLQESGSGERGFFNRGALPQQMPRRRWENFEKDWPLCGTNPCGEVILKSKQFCNLTEVVARAEDTEETLLQKVEIAALIGTYQSMLTDFPFLSPEWKKNCEEERLLGVSITGQMDCPVVRQPQVLQRLRERAVKTNKKWASRFGISPSTAVTCVKPSGTVSLLVDSSAGLHPRFAPYYLRRIRISATDPLFAMLREQGFPFQPEVGQSVENANLYVLEFPVKAPRGAVVQKDVSALEQLKHWKTVKTNYTEHNPSVTISVGADEWRETSAWVFRHWEDVGGLSFLPRSDSVYRLAPYEEISESEYLQRIKALPPVDFSKILEFEKEDHTTGAKAFACTGQYCEIESDVRQ